MKFKDIASKYSKYIIRNDGLACIVFDGYDDALSLKSTEHQRRTMKNGSSRSVVICEENESLYTKERFLSNAENKKSLISLLSTKLTINGHHVYVCNGDADTKIVSTALDASKEKPVTVVADDTDVAVMLIYRWNEELSDIYFHTERGDKCWSIREALKSLSSIKQHILFIHAWLDVILYQLSLEKESHLSSESTSMQAVSETISNYWTTSEKVSGASLKAFKELHGGNSDVLLRKMRYV